MKPFNTKNTLPAIQNFTHQIKRMIYKKVAPINLEFFSTPEPIAFSEINNYTFQPISIGEKWGNLWDCAWFKITGTLPNNYAIEDLAIILDFQGEACIYTESGDTIRALTCINSDFDAALGLPGKTVLPITEIPLKDHCFCLYADAGCNDLFGKFKGGTLLKAEVAICNHELRDFYYDYEVLSVLCKNISADSAQHYSLLYALEKAMHCISSDFTKEEAIKAKKILEPELNRLNSPDYPLEFIGIGHSHLDLAWLWPIRETKRKAVRTLSTAIANIEQYPEYIYGVSQPQQLEWIKESNPLLFEKIKKYVKKGRIELQGAMWVEPDTNCPSGESLVRQILYGTQFYKEEFDVRVNNVWLPDVFGFNGNLPQIIKKSGIDNFLTIKLSWSEFNHFPFHTFNWNGIDNSSILVHLPPEGTYNSNCSAESLRLGETSYIEKGKVDQAMMLFGIGDGGAGPGRDHIERARRLSKNLLGVPKFKYGFARDFFNHIAKDKDKLSTYYGELYLEKHQGTLTTQAKNKYYNRKIEWLLHNVEYVYSHVFLKTNQYPNEILKKIWKEVLLYQFHDILPGSSIHRVYEESVPRYQELIAQLNTLMSAGLEILKKDNKPSILNLNSYPINYQTKLNNQWKCAQLKPYSSAILEDYISHSTSKITKNSMENDNVKITFDNTGAITSIFDKKLNKECLKAKGNVQCVYNDFGDGWDMYINYNGSIAGYFEASNVTEYIDGPLAVRVQTLTFNKSTLTQTITINENSNLITFDNELDWQEDSKMLRTEFEIVPFSKEVICDIQFGNIKRNTTINNSLDYAQFEICGHKYINVSEDNLGVAIINDSKYGYRVKEHLVSLNLMRAPHYPDESADIGKHQYSYAFLAHDNSLDKVIEKAYLFNNQPILNPFFPELPSFISGDNSIVIESIKKAEESDAIIIRLSEQLGKHQKTEFTIDNLFKKVSLTNLIEEPICQLVTNNQKINLDFEPFEIKTLKLERW